MTAVARRQGSQGFLVAWKLDPLYLANAYRSNQVVLLVHPLPPSDVANEVAKAVQRIN